MRRHAWSLLPILILAACANETSDGGRASGASTSNGDSGGTSGHTSVGAHPTEGGSATVAFGCQPECGPGTFCASNSTCIPEGTCVESADCGDGMLCHEQQCVPGGTCGDQQFDLQRVPPNLLILLDRSCSMPLCPNGINPTCLNRSDLDKWGIAVDTINDLLNNFEGQVQWGLELFPDNRGSACYQAPPTIPPAANTETEIQTLLQSALSKSDPWYPSGPCVTNIKDVIGQAEKEQSLRSPDRKSFLLLITDGQEAQCGDPEQNNTETETRIATLHEAGVSTFVLGFGDGVEPTWLNRFAQAGGVPSTSANAYFAAEDSATLKSALTSIAGRVIGCDFRLDEVPPSEDKLYAYFGNERMDRGSDGWHYDAEHNRVTFTGQACERLQRDEVKVQLVYDCVIRGPI